MIKKRLIILLSIMYIISYMPQDTFAYDIKAQTRIGNQEEVPITTDGQLDIDAGTEQTTSDALALLDTLIQETDMLMTKAIIATTPGSYRLEEKEKLNKTYIEVKEARENVETDTDAKELYEKLHIAIVDFKSSRIVDMGQLGLGAYYYGMSKEHEKWGQAHWFDIDHDGNVGIRDLTYLANIIKICGK